MEQQVSHLAWTPKDYYFIGHRLFIYYLTQKSLPDSMIYQIIQISGLFIKDSNSARQIFVK